MSKRHQSELKEALAIVMAMTRKQAGQRLKEFKHGNRHVKGQRVRKFYDDPHTWHNIGPARRDTSAGLSKKFDRFYSGHIGPLLRTPRQIAAKKRQVPSSKAYDDVQQAKVSLLRRRSKGRL